MIAWLDVQGVFALITIAGMILGSWREEKRQARAETRRESLVGEIERKCRRLADQADGYLDQIAKLEVRIRQVEGKLER